MEKVGINTTTCTASLVKFAVLILAEVGYLKNITARITVSGVVKWDVDIQKIKSFEVSQ
jgi:hypothetical protein